MYDFYSVRRHKVFCGYSAGERLSCRARDTYLFGYPLLSNNKLMVPFKLIFSIKGSVLSYSQTHPPPYSPLSCATMKASAFSLVGLLASSANSHCKLSSPSKALQERVNFVNLCHRHFLALGFERSSDSRIQICPVATEYPIVER